MKFIKIVPFVLIGSLLMSSCSISKEVKIEIETNLTNETKVITPKEVSISETYSSIEKNLFLNTQFLPSTGDVNILVIPTIIPGYELVDYNEDGIDDKEQVKQDIKTAFFGGKNLLNESVSSFYKKSSFNQLNINGYVTDWFSIENDSNLNITNGAQIEVDYTYEVVDAAVEWAKNVQGIDLTQYDSDHDGYVDGVWLIYSAHNYYQGGPQTNTNNYFAYTSWGNTTDDGETVPSVTNPIYSVFGWASWDFMYDGTSESKIDSHTYIHEMGHFMGLNDYYTDTASYNPVGRIDMMDGNVGDFNSYSKMLLGWSKPYIVTGNAEISLKSLQNKNNFIVIPSDNTKIVNDVFDPFSEYILVEFYTNDGLFNFSSNESVGGAPLSPSEYGVRIYHIDNRKFLIDYEDPFHIVTKEYEGEFIDQYHKYILPITNNRNPDVYNYYYNLDSEINLYDEIRLIEASGIDTFSNGGYLKAKSFFNEGDEFNMNKYGSSFFINNKFNNKDSFSYSIKIGGTK